MQTDSDPFSDTINEIISSIPIEHIERKYVSAACYSDDYGNVYSIPLSDYSYYKAYNIEGAAQLFVRPNYDLMFHDAAEAVVDFWENTFNDNEF